MGVLSKPIPFGDYFLLEKVNTGGMAEVFKAKTFGAEGFERIVAVKKILPSIAEDTEFISMFINEAKLAAQLSHANIVQTNDLGCINGDYYIAMEYVPGHDLRVIFERCVRTNRKLDIACVCYIISKICEGLDYAHNKKDANGEPMNIIHRDISPQNILISYDGECKLIDFGIAKATNQSNATQVGILKGKFSYMSPEQVSGKTNIDRRSDIFALGIVLFEMLTLKRLFLGASDFETLEKIRKVEVSPPTLYNSAIPEELEDIVLKALEKDVSQRYQTAQEMQEALQRFMFKNNIYYTAKDLSEFCQSMFAQEIALEQKKMEYYKEMTYDVLMQSKKADAQDDETSFYEKQNIPRMSGVQYESVSAQPAPKQAIYAELDDFEPPTGNDIVYSPKNGAHPSGHNENVSSLISAPVVSGFHAPIPRKSMVTMEAVAEGGPRARETVLTDPVSSGRKSSGRSAYLTIAIVLVIIIIGLCTWAVLRKDTGQVKFAIEPKTIESVCIEINNNEKICERSNAIIIGSLSTLKEIKYRVTADNYEPAEGIIKALPKPAFETAKVVLKPVNKSVLSIYVNHDMATVKVDGQVISGNRDFKMENLAPGEHIISVSKEGYETYERKVHFEVGETKSITPELKPEFATLMLRTEPYKARYELRNRRTGATKTGMTDKQGVSIANLPASDEYDITIFDGVDKIHALWKPNVRGANQVETRTFPTTTDPDAKPAVIETPPAAEAAPAPAPRPRPRRAEPKNDVEEEEEEEEIAEEEPEPKPVVRKKTEDAAAKPAPKPAPAADTGVPGLMMVNSKPPANVFINGKDYGSTPKKIQLPAGTYIIRFVNAKNGINTEQTVTLKGGEVKKIMRK